jgi:hypothetical protein
MYGLTGMKGAGDALLSTEPHTTCTKAPNMSRSAPWQATSSEFPKILTVVAARYRKQLCCLCWKQATNFWINDGSSGAKCCWRAEIMYLAQ